MKKALIILGIVFGIAVIGLGAGAYWYIYVPGPGGIEDDEIAEEYMDMSLEEAVGQMQIDTYQVSKDYAIALLEMDQILTVDSQFLDYEEWDAEMDGLLADLEQLEADIADLEMLAGMVAESDVEEPVGFRLIGPVYAFDRQEINRVFDSAPSGKRLETLAKHLDTDVKRAYKLLKIAQDETTAAAYDDAGDTFQRLETTARVIKDGAKVGAFVGGAVLTGGTTAGASLLSQAATIAGGADLLLEVGEDAAMIGLGYNSRAAVIIGGMRKWSEPIGSVLAFSDLSSATNAFDEFGNVMFGLDQLNSILQDEKFMGFTFDDINQQVLSLDGLSDKDIKKWLKDNKIPEKPDKPADILGEEINSDVANLGTDLGFGLDDKPVDTEPEENSEPDPEPEKKETKKETCDIVGVWEYDRTVEPGGNYFITDGAEEMTYTFREDGTMHISTSYGVELEGVYEFENCEGSWGYERLDEESPFLEIVDNELFEDRPHDQNDFVYIK